MNVILSLGATVDLQEIPQAVADALSIPLFGGQLLCSLFILMLATFPVLIYTRGRDRTTPLVLGIIALCFVVAIGWLDYWILLVIVFLVALGWAGFFKNKIGR